MLFIVVIPLIVRVTFSLVGASTSNEDFAPCLLFESLLVDAFGPNQESHIVYPCGPGKIDLGLKLVVIGNCLDKSRA
jgi:hypothetical protein